MDKMTEENMDIFIAKTNALLESGFKILSSSCNSKKYKAILGVTNESDKSKKDELINFLHYVTVNYEIESESIYELEYGEQ